MNAFERLHPGVIGLYFLGVLVLLMSCRHPIVLGFGLISGLIQIAYFEGKKALVFHVKSTVPFGVLCGLLNPVFNHQGVTVLAYVGNNPITMESIYYGIVIACFMINMILWFALFYTMMDSDKIMQLLSPIFPTIGLLFAMVLGFVPKMKRRIKQQQLVQKTIFKKKSFKLQIQMFSMVISWALEQAVETADAMKARGYEQPHHSSYRKYCWHRKDWQMLALVLVICMAQYGFVFFHSFQTLYFPMIAIQNNHFTILAGMIFLIFSFIPMIYEVKEAFRWRRLQ